MPVTYSENAQLVRGVTQAVQSGYFDPDEPLNEKLGAPWEICVKSRSNNEADWGSATYSTSSDATGRPSAAAAKKIGGAIHRILKFYLQDEYIVNNIESVKLIVVLKSNTS